MHKSPLSLSAQRFEAAQVEVVQFIGVIGSDRRWPFARTRAASYIRGQSRFITTFALNCGAAEPMAS